MTLRLRAGSATQAAGARCEDLALAHLRRAGLTLVERNFHCRYGEIDLVMRDGDVVVFVEVRYRRGARVRGGHGGGIDSVGTAKRAKLLRAAAVWLARNPRCAQAPCRFDVVGLAGSEAEPVVDWRPNAFEAT